MFEINIYKLSGELLRTVNVNTLTHTRESIQALFSNVNFYKCFKIVNNDCIIYTDLYELEYDIITLNEI